MPAISPEVPDVAVVADGWTYFHHHGADEAAAIVRKMLTAIPIHVSRERSTLKVSAICQALWPLELARAVERGPAISLSSHALITPVRLSDMLS